MDPVMVAYLAAGGMVQQPGRHLVDRCSRCMRLAQLSPASSVVSRTFTGFDSWAAPAGRGLCASCTWLYSTPQLRLQPHRVTQQPPSLTACSPADLLAELTAGALAPTAAIAVPLRPGRKHVFAELSWGTIRTDTVNLAWTAADAALLRDLAELRTAGFGPRMLTEPAPPYRVLHRHDPTTWTRLQQLWQSLDVWRRHSLPHLELAIAVTRTVTP